MYGKRRKGHLRLDTACGELMRQPSRPEATQRACCHTLRGDAVGI
jgi:hypothetical protein